MIRWSAVLLADGEPVTGEVPCLDWVAADLLGPLVVGWLGGPVSIVRAVSATRDANPAQPSLFDDEQAVA
jgi:hypothetical protein